MARHEDDADDLLDNPRNDDDDDIDGADEPSGWRNWLLKAALALIGAGVGFLVPYVLYLNHQVGERFGALQWQVPTRVYARPLQLLPGTAMDAATLKTELDAAAYQDDGEGKLPGTYAVDGGRFSVSSRGYTDVDGKVAAKRVQVLLSGNGVASLRDLDRNGAALKAARFDPARIATLYGQKQEERRLVRLEEVPELLVTGLQAVEDKDFAHHHGIDVSGMLRAGFKFVVSAGRERQGASTLTQQLVRSGILGIGKERTLTRKFNEIIYSLLLEARYDKHTILEAYFNQVYWGQRGNQAILGVSAASEYWFGRDLNGLSTEQIALLVGLVKGPSFYDPRHHPDRALARRHLALQKMLENSLISQDEFTRADAAPLEVTESPGIIAANRFPAYVDLVRRQLAHDYPESSLQGAGLSVMTGMSPAAQAYAEGAVVKTINTLQKGKRPPLQAGVVVTDVHDGDVLAVVGGRDVTEVGGFNRAVEAQRQVGSLLKPFIYLLALARPDQYSLASYIDDSPVTVQLGRDRTWTPDNDDGLSHGMVRIVDALAKSYNHVAVRIGMQDDPKRIAQLLHALAGIDAEPNPSLILGATGQSPYAIAQLYQFLASGGQIQPLHAVRGVLDANNNVLHRYDEKPAPAQEGDQVAAHLISVAMQHVITEGTGRALLSDGLGRLSPAGKTGTSNDGRDSWFAGFTGDHLAVVWMGNDQNAETGLFGATGGMRVWSSIFQHLPTSALNVPGKGLDYQWVLDDHGTDPTCPGARQLPFVAGFAPPYQPCAIPTEAQNVAGTVSDAPAQDPQNADATGGFWHRLFGGSTKKPETPPPQPAPAPQNP